MSKVLSRNDCQADFWKEKFISGLPNLFAERVKNRLKAKTPTNSIKWNDLTYGDISAEITAEGIALCNDLKLKLQLDLQKEENRNILGDFCEQIGFQPISYPKRKEKISKKRNKFFKRKNFEKKENSPRRFKKSKPKTKSTPTDSKQPVCWKCGRIGHKANKCFAKKKINNLNISKELKDSLNKVLFSLDENQEQKDWYINLVDDSEISDNSSTDNELTDKEDCKSDCECESCFVNFMGFEVNMITNEENFILDLIDQIHEP